MEIQKSWIPEIQNSVILDCGIMYVGRQICVSCMSTLMQVFWKYKIAEILKLWKCENPEIVEFCIYACM